MKTRETKIGRDCTRHRRRREAGDDTTTANSHWPSWVEETESEGDALNMNPGATIAMGSAGG